ncbi:MAG: ATP-binding protein [Deltaproteobacteria bacterium]|nr:ATP-binding protein [Deltaproteobacteria bacterium]
MITRNAAHVLAKMASQFKAVAVVGPRQAGKTTLAKMTFPNKPYVSLEFPDERERAIRDPRLFLSRYPDGGILDEVQRAPELLSYIQGIIDARSETGQFILTGSQQFGMMQHITQSLAGRIATVVLLPFSLTELQSGNYVSDNLNEAMCNSAYPPVFDQHIDPLFWLDSYIGTYVERDVRQIVNVQDTLTFQRFLSLCAGNVGQLFNASRIGNDCGLNHGTVTKWLSVLEASFIAFRLPPHYRNYRKRLVKTPKLYFYDTGLAIRLLGIESATQLATHPLRGSLFENWVIAELMKHRFNMGRKSNLFFWRNNTGLEVDVVIERAEKLQPVEIKAGATLATDWVKGLKQWQQLAQDDVVCPTLIYGGTEPWQEDGIDILPWIHVDRVINT